VANEITHLRLKRTGEWKTHTENAKAIGMKILKTTDKCLMTPNMSREKLEYIYIYTHTYEITCESRMIYGIEIWGITEDGDLYVGDILREGA
jgi:hypothetical protein